jgi:hypothetical protein
MLHKQSEQNLFGQTASILQKVRSELSNRLKEIELQILVNEGGLKNHNELRSLEASGKDDLVQ